MLSYPVMAIGGVKPQAPYPADRDKLEVLPIDSIQQVDAIHFAFAHMFYGQDELIGERVLAGLPLQKKEGALQPLVLFDTVAPGWQAERWRAMQQKVLTQLVDPERLMRVPDGVRRTLCQELWTLDQNLAAPAADASNLARQQQAEALRTILADVLASGSGNTASCPR
jgi:hypothetical protein